MRLFLAALVLTLAILPATLALPEAHACQPLSYYCALNGHYYYVCGTTVPPPAVQCALDTVRDAHWP
ncbi:MAG TPA: hypothetical protein VM370_03335 [Candidatus Thermoplasmatota archaeon]|nr:hypothetical protein [Candidatus Thermoplasmatota archaeon]